MSEGPVNPPIRKNENIDVGKKKKSRIERRNLSKKKKKKKKGRVPFH